MKDSDIVKLTKRYILDFLNALFFSRTVSWDGDDQYNQLPIVSSEEEDGKREEQRGVLLVHKKYTYSVRTLISVVEDSSQKVCYRISNVRNKVVLDNPRKICSPLEVPDLDFSISDLNLGIQEASAYSFADLGDRGSSRVFSLLSFLLESYPVVHEDISIFEDLKMDQESWPPYSGDSHYKPIYGVSE